MRAGYRTRDHEGGQVDERRRPETRRQDEEAREEETSCPRPRARRRGGEEEEEEEEEEERRRLETRRPERRGYTWGGAEWGRLFMQEHSTHCVTVHSAPACREQRSSFDANMIPIPPRMVTGSYK